MIVSRFSGHILQSFSDCCDLCLDSFGSILLGYELSQRRICGGHGVFRKR